MPELTHRNLFRATVPAEWAPLLSVLAETESVTHDESSPREDRRARLVSLREHLLEKVRTLEGTLPLEHARPESLTRYFCEAVLLWTHYPRSGARLVYSTVESSTLPHFELDLPDEPSAIAAVKEALCDAFDVSEATLGEWERDLEHQASNLRIKRAIVEELIRRLKNAGSDRNAELLRMFQNVYGPWPFRPGDIGLFAAEAALVFVAPYRGGRLDTPDFATRPVQERRILEGYLRIVEAGTWKTDRFPGFGELDTDALDPEFLRELTAALSDRRDLPALNETVVRDTLHTMVTFLASHDVEGYLVHDLWGHTWQETLAEFEWDYYRLETVVREPIGLDTGSMDAHGHRIFPPLIDAFGLSDGRVMIDEAVALEALQRELRLRVRLSLNAVVAEALADITEFKYAHGERTRGATLPSSSLLYDSPIKHDLTSRDILFHYRRWRQSFRELIDDVAVRGKLSGQIGERLGTHSGAREAVDRLAELMRTELEQTALSSHRTVDVKDGQITIDIVQRTQAAAARLDRDLVDAIERGQARLDALRTETPELPRWRCPEACLDLLVMVLGWFFERDRDVLFWHLDELLRDELPPLLAKLGAALRSEQGR